MFFLICKKKCSSQCQHHLLHAARDPSVKNKTLHHLKVFTSAWMFRLVFVNHQGHFISSVMHLSSFCTISYQYHTPGTSFLFFSFLFFLQASLSVLHTLHTGRLVPLSGAPPWPVKQTSAANVMRAIHLERSRTSGGWRTSGPWRPSTCHTQCFVMFPL